MKVSLQRLSRDVVVTLADRHYTVSWENGQNESGFLYDDIINKVLEFFQITNDFEASLAFESFD